MSHPPTEECIPVGMDSKLCAIRTYTTKYDNIFVVTEELDIREGDVPSMNKGRRDTMADSINFLAEVHTVVHQLVADRKVTVFRASRLLSELYKYLLDLYGAINTTVKVLNFSVLKCSDCSI